MAERASPKQKIDDQACQGRQDAGDHKDRDEDLWKRKENGDAQLLVVFIASYAGPEINRIRCSVVNTMSSGTTFLLCLASDI